MYITKNYTVGPADVASFQTGERTEIKSVSVNLQPQQDLHGYASPWPAGGGKNLVNVADASGSFDSYYYNTIVLGFAPNADTTYTLSFDVTSTVEPFNISVGLGDSSYSLDLVYKNGINNGRASITFTPTSAQLSGRPNLFARAPRYSAATSCSYTIKNVQLEVGSSDTSFAPYENICPITGYSGANIWDDPVYTETINWNQLAQNGDFSNGTTGWRAAGTTDLSVSDGVVSASNATGANFFGVYMNATNAQCIKGHKYFLSIDVKVSVADLTVYRPYFDVDTLERVSGNTTTTASTAWSTIAIIANCIENGTALLGARKYTGSYGSEVTMYMKNPLVIDLTQMFGSTVADYISTLETATPGAGVSFFRNLFPKDYYAYNAGETTCVSAVNGDPYRHVLVSIPDTPGTVYGATIDPVNGTLTVDRASYTVTSTGDIGRNDGNRYYILQSKTGAIKPASDSADLLCDRLKSAVGNYYDNRCFINNSGAIRWNTPTDYPTTAEMLSGLGGSITFVYPLETPVVYALTPQTMKAISNSLNNVWSDSGQVTVKYISIEEVGGSSADNYKTYLETLKTDYVKLTKLEFLNPGGNVAFSLDNNALNKRSGAFIQSGTISCNLQNGRRRQASITLANLDNEYEFAVNHIWFGQQIRLSEGLILPDGTEYYIPQGIFEIETPSESLQPGQKTVTYSLVDKWANLDGTLMGNLEDVYSVTAGTNIFSAIAALLKLGKYDMEAGTPYPIDPADPIFTDYYNDKTQTLTDGSTVSLIEAPYDFTSGSTGNMAEVVLGLVEMIAGDVGYNQTGRLVVNPSQDDILDADKPVLWDFTMNDKSLLGVSYTTKASDVYNDVIVVGATSDTNATARGRAQNQDPASDTCISRIGRKTTRIEMSNYYSDDICQDYAVWKLKRFATASKTVTVTCTQMFHIVENELITLQRSDKPGSPIERHVVQGFSRPLAQKGSMTINCVSVNDYPIATLIESDYSGGN